jgi:shikimate dehydrogenase
MHNAAYRAIGMNRVYIACRVRIERLALALRGAEAMGFVGINLTVPHKQAALSVLSQVSAEARILGAANCIIPGAGGLFGDNTDARGLQRDLRKIAPRLAGKSAIVVGAGGAASSAVLALARLRAAQIVIANRTVARARSMVRRLREAVGAVTSFDVTSLDALMDPATIGGASIIVNATSVGLDGSHFLPLLYDAARQDCFFYDLIYSSRPTPFLAPAIRRGLRTADGAGMLLYQGVLAFRMFNRTPAPVEVMRRELMAKLGRLQDGSKERSSRSQRLKTG